VSIDSIVAGHGPVEHGDAVPARPVHALLVEDSEGFAYFIRDVLMRKNVGRFELKEATTLADGLAALLSDSVDVILLDLGLPDSTRIETFKRVHAASPETPVIILTVLNDDDVALEAMRTGAQDYLIKDQITENLLLRSIRYALERARSQKTLHQLSARLLELQDEERRRVARALHESTAQSLAALSLNLSALQSRADALPRDLRELIEESAGFVDGCSQEVRTMSYLLHPPLLDEMGLSGAVREYVDGFAGRSGIRVDLELPADLERLPRETETALFRVMQECLTNIHRHSGSPTASVQIAREERGITLNVRDAGRGAAGRTPADGEGASIVFGVGIAGMQERLRQLGGRLHIQSSEKGTAVSAFFPFRG
jgi:signal transduction histidine kinase